MDSKPPFASAAMKREPLGDATLRANIHPVHHRTKGTPSSSSIPSVHKLPHHESLLPHAPHNVRSVASSSTRARSPAVQNNDDSKRDSLVSTTSTAASTGGRRRKTHIGPWQLGSDVGKGGCGKVRKVRHCLTGEVAAVKIISKKVAEKERAESLVSLVERSKRAGTSAEVGVNVMPFGIEREVVIMKLLEHRNVVRLLDVWENRNELYLVMEFVNGGELLEHIERCEYLDEDETVWIFRQVLAALLHCHRLGIHHRDLKPENILLQITKDDTIEVKLVDFGMAALQPRGKLLTTPCGSVHYAAPEVFDKCYDGNKVDVWSLGVILYVMLLGRTPFSMPSDDSDYDSTVWSALIKSGRFNLPEHLSTDAKDLIRKMLVPNSNQRINLKDVWNHPLLHKYEAEWGESPDANKLEKWIGHAQRIETWLVKQKQDIDREILRNLRTLWHSEKEEVLVAKLLSPEVNKEKEFYTALVKHREDQLENYVGIQNRVGQSTSDYQHAKRHVLDEALPELPASAYDPTKSQYSILNEAKTLKKRKSHQSLPSVRSYDPYRASRIPVLAGSQARSSYVAPKVNTKITVHNAGKPYKPLAPRVEALKGEERRFSATPSASSSPNLRSSTVSRSSVLSSAHSQSSRGSRLVHPNIGHKRGVSFSHLRKSSTANLVSAKGRAAQKINASSSPRSPRILTAQVIVSRKPHPVKKQTTRPTTQSYNHLINSEARKVSTELEKICDEAFKYSDSSSRTSAATSRIQYETPPSSISNRASAQSFDLASSDKRHEAAPQNVSPPPSASSETPVTFIAREIAKTRKRLAERYNQDRSAHSSTYSEVLAHLDALLEPPVVANQTKNELYLRAPALEPRYPGYSYLPVISEENRSFDGEETNTDGVNDTLTPATGLSTAPFRQHAKNSATRDTIRVLDPSSPAVQVAPLNIRKMSETSSGSRSDHDENTILQHHVDSSLDRNISASKRSRDGVFSSLSIEENDHLQPGPLPRKKGWFGRKVSESVEKPMVPSSPRTWQDLDDRIRPDQTSATHDANSTSYNNQFYLADNSYLTALPVNARKPSFFKFWNKKAPKSKNRMAFRVVDDDFDSNISTTTLSLSNRASSVLTMRDGLHPTDLEPRDLGVQRSWLSRFLKIKPATTTICFQAGRGLVRHKLMKLLRSAKAVGMRDVELDRERNLVFASLDANNAYGIKEVSFVAQLYIVLVNGRRAQLCLARFTQRRGAASSFRKIMEKIQDVLGESGLVVQDAEKEKDMMAMLEGV